MITKNEFMENLADLAKADKSFTPDLAFLDVDVKPECEPMVSKAATKLSERRSELSEAVDVVYFLMFKEYEGGRTPKEYFSCANDTWAAFCDNDSVQGFLSP